MGRCIQFIVEEAYDGRKAVQFLRGKAGLSCRLVQLLKHLPDGIQLNGSHIRTIDPLHTGDTLTVTLPDESMTIEPVHAPLDVRYEDDDLLVLNKPPHLAMHPSHNHQGDTLANAVAGHLLARGKPAAFHAVGRLDRDTSGVVVCALHQYAAARLAGQVKKTYLAVAAGLYTGSGVIDAPIIRPDPLHSSRAVGEGGAHAVTHWTALRRDEVATLLRVTLETGRTHQIRVHFAHLGTPLVGDTMYGAPDERIGRQALHCAEACLLHPVSGKPMEFCVPLPGDMAKLTEKMR